MKISIHSTVNGKMYDVYFSLKDGNRPAPLERVFRDTFVKDLLYYEDSVDQVIASMNSRPLNVNIYDIKESKSQ